MDVGLDTADTFASLGGEADVALLTPVGGPRVLDDPVVLTLFSPVAYHEDGVVDIAAALLVGEDA